MERKISITEFNRSNEACSRFFPQPRWSYLRAALRAATILTSVSGLSPRDRDYHQRVRDINLAAVRQADAR